MKISAINFNIIKSNTFISPKTRYQNPFLKSNFDTFTFSGNLEKQKEMVEEKRQIKALLQEVKDKNETISARIIVQKLSHLNMSETKVLSRIHSDKDIEKLWDSVKTKEKIIFTSDEKAEFKAAVGQILKDASNKSQKVSIDSLCRQIGVSRRIITDIIDENDEYKALYENVRKVKDKKYGTEDEIKAEEKQIETLLLLALENGEKASVRQIAKQMGLCQATIHRRIENNDYLSKLYEQVKMPAQRPTQEASKNTENELEQLLEQCLINNQKMTQTDVIQKIKMSNTTFYAILSRNEKINSLWQQVKKQEYNRYTKEELTDLDDFIHKFLSDKYDNHETTTLVEIAQYFDVSKAMINKRIQNNPVLKVKWNRVKSQSMQQFDDFLIKEQTSEIIRILKEIKQEERKITKDEIAATLNISRGTVHNRIISSPVAKKLWNEVRSQKHTYFNNYEVQKQNIKIKNAIIALINSNQKITISEISKMTNIDRDVITRRLSSNKELNTLWQEAVNK